MATNGKHLLPSSRKRGAHKNKLIIAVTVLSVLVLAFLFLFFFTTLLDRVPPEEPKPLKIGRSKYDYPPMHYKENGEFVGFDIELAQAAAEIMGVEIEFVQINWSEATDLLANGEVDMLWGGLERASLDEKVMKFTKAYLRSNIVLLMPTDRDYSEWTDLQGLSVCALNFTAAFNYLQVYNRDVIKSKRSFTPPEYQALTNSLSTGEFDCLITDTAFASFYLKLNSGEALKMSETVMGSSYAVAVRIDDTGTFDKLQSALDELEANGTIEMLRSKYIGN